MSRHSNNWSVLEPADRHGAARLRPRLIEKRWGVTPLPKQFDYQAPGARIGEVWFESEAGGSLPLLIKYIFADGSLSIQVHPDDDNARCYGLSRGKEEAWYVLNAKPGSRVGLGLAGASNREQLHSAALDGTIESILDWRPLESGDFVHIPPGMIHALQGQVTLLEVGTSVDATFRLFDYESGRTLHVDKAVAASRPDLSADKKLRKRSELRAESVLLEGSNFSLLKGALGSPILSRIEQRTRWVVPLEGRVQSGTATGKPGDCLLLDPGAPLDLTPDCELLIAIEGGLD